MRFPDSALALATALSLTLCATGCYVKVNKDKDGSEKDVSIHTPLGGLQVHKNGGGAQDTGLPAYPGAVVIDDKDGDKSADVRLGFGKWQLRVKAVNYKSADSQDKVLAFYKTALGRYGDVIECQGNHAVGTPTVTHEGLNCNDDKKKDKGAKLQVNEDKDLQLRAGSEHHQHIVGFDEKKGDGTRFALVQLDLPSGSPGASDDADKE